MENPICIGDVATVYGENWVVADVRDDLVLINGEWRHWGNCMYGARVIERIVAFYEERDKSVMAQQRAALERLVGPLDEEDPPFIPMSEPLDDETVRRILNNEDD